MKYPPTRDYSEKGFAPPLKPGDYIATIEEIKEQDKDGNPYRDKNGFEYCLFEFSVKDYPDNKLFDRFCFDTENPHANINLGRFKQLQIACGIDFNKEGDTSDLIDKSCKVTVANREYQGNIRNNISQYKSLNGDANVSDDEDLPF